MEGKDFDPPRTKKLPTEEQKNKISNSVRKLWEDDSYRERLTRSHLGKTTSPRQKYMAKKINHVRWHTNRNIKSENCAFCIG